MEGGGTIGVVDDEARCFVLIERRGGNERDEQVRQCAAMNEQMYGVAKEILAAHEAMDMGDVMKIRQPFAGGARVKFEELAQMYGDELYQTIFDAPIFDEFFKKIFFKQI